MPDLLHALPLPPLYYQPDEGSYWKEDINGRWIKINEGTVKLEIRAAGYDGKNGNNITDADRCFLDLQARQNLAYAGPLAGHRAGLRVINENRVLVTASPRVVVPREGEWPTLRLLFERMFADSEHDQLTYFYGWVKQGVEAMQTGRWSEGQALAMAGPIKSGKSLTQRLLTELFGGRVAKPYLYMTGGTTFNEDHFWAEHLMVEDEAESKDFRARTKFAASIKGIAVNRDHHCHGKHKRGLTLTPIWRLTISLNDQPGRLLVLPPMNEDVADKVMLLKVRACDMPMPTTTAAQKAQFWDTLIAELPAFAHYLQTWVLPAEFQCSRCGVRHFHHPDLLAALKASSPEHRLLEIIDASDIFNGGPLGTAGEAQWEGGSLELEQTLTRNASPVEREAQKLLTYQNVCGTLLSALEDEPNLNRVRSRKVRGKNIWTIQPPPREARAPGLVSIPRPMEDDEVPRPPAGIGAVASPAQ